jgi:hypothetical protein
VESGCAEKAHAKQQKSRRKRRKMRKRGKECGGKVGVDQGQQETERPTSLSDN